MYSFTKGLLIRKIKDLPFIWYLYKVYTERKVASRLNRLDNSAEKVFSSFFKNNDWQNDESRSGPGSTLEHTRILIEKLPGFLEKHQIRCMLDAPCGDFNWMRNVDKKNIRYVGGDIVKELVDANNSHYGTDQISFLQLNIISDPLPEVDLIFVRDCLVHFNDESIMGFLKNLASSKIRYLLTTNFPFTKHNYNISIGNFKFINLQRKPYNLPKEKDILWEESKEARGQCPDKALFLWEVDSIRTIYNG